MSYKWNTPIDTTIGLTNKKTFTAHGILIGNSGTNSVDTISPDATVGKPILSAGASSVPAYTTLLLTQGGTDATSFVAYSPVCVGDTTTDPLQSVASLGTANNALTSNGAGSLPTFSTSISTSVSTLTSINMQVFTSSGTYTPTANLLFYIVEAVGGGGGGGGVAANSAGYGSGGGAGACIKAQFAANGSQTVTIGAGGTGGANTGGTGGTGGTTSVGSLVSATGGSGGVYVVASGTATKGLGGLSGGTEEDGELVFHKASGRGGSSSYGGAGRALCEDLNTTSTVAGNAGTGYGSGGGGAYKNNTSASGATGGAGSAGIVIITEFVS